MPGMVTCALNYAGAKARRALELISSRPAWATQNPVSKKQTKIKTKQKLIKQEVKKKLKVNFDIKFPSYKFTKQGC